MANLRRVPRGLRALNSLALLLFLAGAGLYARAWLGMNRLQSFEAPPGAGALAGMEQYASLLKGSWIAVALVVTALGVAVAAAVVRLVLERRHGLKAEASQTV